jgi:hypothetical protein
LSPHLVDPKHANIFNSVYDAWRASFKEVVESAGGKLDPDDFFRNDLVSAVLHKNEVVALSTMTMFDLRLRSSHEHHYIQALQAGTVQKLQADKLHRLISIEYLNVLPAWRKTHSQVRWTEVMIGLGLKVMDDSVADIIMGTPRTDVKVLDVCKNLEAIEVQEPINKMNYPCAVVIFHKNHARKFKDSTTGHYVETLYKNHLVTGAQPFIHPQSHLKVA